MNNPLVISVPVSGQTVQSIVKAIHEATLEGYVPVYSQCVVHFGNMTVTMKKDEGDKVETTSTSISTGSSEATNESSSKEDSGSSATDTGAESDSVGDGAGDSKEPDDGDAGNDISDDKGAGEEKPVETKTKRTSTRKKA
ncbi:hypothetical protein BRC2024_KCUCJSVR_CDS_0178 [Acinetobacter phage vB_AbaM_KissB]